LKKSILTATIIGLYSPIIVFAADSQAMPHDITDSVHIRSLAASCAACHGTNGNSANSGQVEKTASLAGMNATDFKSKILAFKSGERAATVMHRHAKGLSAQEIADLAEYFSAQIPRSPIPLPSQKLIADHAN